MSNGNAFPNQPGGGQQPGPFGNNPQGPMSQPTPPAPQGPPNYGPSAPQYGAPQQPQSGPQQQYGGQQFGGPQQPQQPQGQYGYSSPYGAPAPAPKKKSPLPWIIGGGAIGLVLLLLVGFLVMRGVGDGPVRAGQPHKTPAGSVQAYFDALTAGDAAGALRMAYTDPADKTFLTNEVLSAALKDTPITELQINAPSSSSSVNTDVHVTYKIGDEEVSDTINTMKDGDVYKLMYVTKNVYLSQFESESIDVKINGVKLVGGKAALFPGTYTVTTDSKYFDVKPNSFLVKSPGYATSTSTSSLKLQLTDGAQSDIRTAAKTALTGCLNAKKMINPDCGIRFNQPAGTTAVESTLSCSVTSGADAIDKATFSTVYGSPGTVRAYVSISVRCTVKGANGKGYYGNVTHYKVEADLSKDPIKVTFD